MAKVIRFPENNDKIRTVKTANQKALIFISLSSVILFALILNFSYQSAMNKQRTVANVGALDQAVSEGANFNLNNWVLTNLNSSNNVNEVVFAERPNAQEQLEFATLIGRYDVMKSKDFITELKLKSGSQPVKFAQLPTLLNQFRQANGIQNLQFKLVDKSGLEQNYELYTLDKKVGTLLLKFSEDNSLLYLHSTWN